MASYIVQTALLFREAKCFELMSPFGRLDRLDYKHPSVKNPAKKLQVNRQNICQDMLRS